MLEDHHWLWSEHKKTKKSTSRYRQILYKKRSILNKSSLHSGLGQATYTCVPLSPNSIIWYQPTGMISLAGKVTAGLVESNSSLQLGL